MKERADDRHRFQMIRFRRDRTPTIRRITTDMLSSSSSSLSLSPNDDLNIFFFFKGGKQDAGNSNNVGPKPVFFLWSYTIWKMCTSLPAPVTFSFSQTSAFERSCVRGLIGGTSIVWWLLPNYENKCQSAKPPPSPPYSRGNERFPISVEAPLGAIKPLSRSKK